LVDLRLPVTTDADFCSEAMLKGWKEDEKNTLSSDEQFAVYLKFYNECFKVGNAASFWFVTLLIVVVSTSAHLVQRPDDMHLGIHLCRGNYMGSRHFSEGAYDRIASDMFTKLNADTFYLEYDTPRAGGFEPLKELPKGKNVVLGVVTSKFAELEDVDEMVKRIHEAADRLAEGREGCTREEALKQLSVSPQCGFASHAEVS